MRISDEARASIDAHCLKHGITITAWIEAVGMRLHELDTGTDDPAERSLRQISDETNQTAREIDAQRRARGSRNRGS